MGPDTWLALIFKFIQFGNVEACNLKQTVELDVVGIYYANCSLVQQKYILVRVIDK